jgi:hypothetical protein
MYWNIFNFMNNFILGAYILLQTDSPGVTVDYNLLQLAMGVLLGLVPGIITGFAARKRWYGGEQSVTVTQSGVNQAEAIENIAQAASLIATQSQTLSDKSASLVSLLEGEVVRQQAVIEEERALRLAVQARHQDEICSLKNDIAQINERIAYCSDQIKALIHDLKAGVVIDIARLDAIENSLS